MPAVVAGEIQRGIELTRSSDAAKAQEIEAWLEAICGRIPVLPADERIFRAQARLRARHKTLDHEDSLVAATAVVHDVAIATRNVKDFGRLGLAFLNPFDIR